MSEATPLSAADVQVAGKLPLTSGDLPPYTRSLLRIKVPVVVTLAEKRQKLGSIVELAPGSIIQFDKPCERCSIWRSAIRP